MLRNNPGEMERRHIVRYITLSERGERVITVRVRVVQVDGGVCGHRRLFTRGGGCDGDEKFPAQNQGQNR